LKSLIEVLSIVEASNEKPRFEVPEEDELEFLGRHKEFDMYVDRRLKEYIGRFGDNDYEYIAADMSFAKRHPTLKFAVEMDKLKSEADEQTDQRFVFIGKSPVFLTRETRADVIRRMKKADITTAAIFRGDPDGKWKRTGEFLSVDSPEG
jgi:hypothetical protein